MQGYTFSIHENTTKRTFSLIIRGTGKTHRRIVKQGYKQKKFATADISRFCTHIGNACKPFDFNFDTRGVLYDDTRGVLNDDTLDKECVHMENEQFIGDEDDMEEVDCGYEEEIDDDPDYEVDEDDSDDDSDDDENDYEEEEYNDREKNDEMSTENWNCDDDENDYDLENTCSYDDVMIQDKISQYGKGKRKVSDYGNKQLKKIAETAAQKLVELGAIFQGREGARDILGLIQVGTARLLSITPDDACALVLQEMLQKQSQSDGERDAHAMNIFCNAYKVNTRLGNKDISKMILGLLLVAYPDYKTTVMEALEISDYHATAATDSAARLPGYIESRKKKPKGATFRVPARKLDPLISFLDANIATAPATVQNRDKGVLWILGKCPKPLFAAYQTVVAKDLQISQSTFRKVVRSKFFAKPSSEECYCTTCLEKVHLFDTQIPDLLSILSSHIECIENSSDKVVMTTFMKEMKSLTKKLESFLSASGGVNTHMTLGDTNCGQHCLTRAFSSQSDPAICNERPTAVPSTKSLAIAANTFKCTYCAKYLAKGAEWYTCRGRPGRATSVAADAAIGDITGTAATVVAGADITCTHKVHKKCHDNKNVANLPSESLYRCEHCSIAVDAEKYTDYCPSCSLLSHFIGYLQQLVTEVNNNIGVGRKEIVYNNYRLHKIIDSINEAHRHIAKATASSAWIRHQQITYLIDDFHAVAIRDYSSKLPVKDMLNTNSNNGRTIANEVQSFLIRNPCQATRDSYPDIAWSKYEPPSAEGKPTNLIQRFMEFLSADTSYNGEQPNQLLMIGLAQFKKDHPWITNIGQQSDSVNYYRNMGILSAMDDVNKSDLGIHIDKCIFSCPGHGKDCCDRRTQVTKKLLTVTARVENRRLPRVEDMTNFLNECQSRTVASGGQPSCYYCVDHIPRSFSDIAFSLPFSSTTETLMKITPPTPAQDSQASISTATAVPAATSSLPKKTSGSLAGRIQVAVRALENISSPSPGSREGSTEDDTKRAFAAHTALCKSFAKGIGISQLQCVHFPDDGSMVLKQMPHTGQGVALAITDVEKLKFQEKSEYPPRSRPISCDVDTVNTMKPVPDHSAEQNAVAGKQEMRMKILQEKHQTRQDAIAECSHQFGDGSYISKPFEQPRHRNSSDALVSSVVASLLSTKPVPALIDGKVHIDNADGVILKLTANEFQGIAFSPTDPSLIVDCSKNIVTRLWLLPGHRWVSTALPATVTTTQEHHFIRGPSPAHFRPQGWARKGVIPHLLKPSKKWSNECNEFLLKLFLVHARMDGTEMHARMKDRFQDPQEVKSPTQITSFIKRIADLRKRLGQVDFTCAVDNNLLLPALLTHVEPEKDSDEEN